MGEVTVDLYNGIRCQGCATPEAECARAGCSCCAACTHTFDGGETRKFLCFGCNRIITSDSQKLPETGLCRLCVGLRGSGVEVKQRPACVPSAQECAQPLPEPPRVPKPPTPPKSRPDMVQTKAADSGLYHWHVSHSGLAHLWGGGARMSYCGMVRGPAYGPPEPEWDAKCKRCANAWYWTSVRAESA